eukprot:1575837-Rhodomonas_salina.1
MPRYLLCLERHVSVCSIAYQEPSAESDKEERRGARRGVNSGVRRKSGGACACARGEGSTSTCGGNGGGVSETSTERSIECVSEPVKEGAGGAPGELRAGWRWCWGWGATATALATPG